MARARARARVCGGLAASGSEVYIYAGDLKAVEKVSCDGRVVANDDRLDRRSRLARLFDANQLNLRSWSPWGTVDAERRFALTAAARGGSHAQ